MSANKNYFFNASSSSTNPTDIDDMSTDNKLDKLLLDLKIISNIKEYDKVSTASDTIKIDTPSILQGIVRNWNRDGREETVKRIDEIINLIFKITDELLENETTVTSVNSTVIVNRNFKDDTVSIFQRIVIHLTESISGLQNLKITYLKDVSITSRIDLVINKIQNRIHKINKMMHISPSRKR